MNSSALLEMTDRGLYCPDGDFFIDPWLPVDRAVITHAHSDHARWGSKSYLTSVPGERVLRLRVGDEAAIETVPYRKSLTLGNVTLSLHPAGHILGSSQVRVERDGEVWVFSGDYKTGFDPTAGLFEPLRCHTFITESTFGLPIYRWRPQAETFAEINDWWAGNRERGWTSVIYAYALGKSQRIIAGIDSSIGPIAAHGAVLRFLPAYANAGVELPKVRSATFDPTDTVKGKGLIIAPPSAAGTSWLRKFGQISEAFVSGWMQIRGARRRRSVDRGFVLSDHADWNGLLSTIAATGAQNIGVTHGYTDVLVRYLGEHGFSAWVLPTRFGGDEESGSDEDDAAGESAQNGGGEL